MVEPAKHTEPVPGWQHLNAEIKKLFYSPFKDSENLLGNEISAALSQANNLKPETDSGPAFLGDDPAFTIDIENVKNISLPQKGDTISNITSSVIKMFRGLPSWGHPLTLCNVSPQGNIASIIASLISQLFSPNTLEGEYAWNTARAELESAGMLADLAGWDPKKAGGIYTYGGSGCWMYHLKYALARVVPGSRDKGIRTDVKVICSQQAHYTMMNSSDWTGLGMNNIICVRTATDSNAMDLLHLEEILATCQANQIPVASIVCTMATTDANAFDPVKGVWDLLQKYPNPNGYGQTLLYCDAVIGWAWLTFKNYDYAKNPLGFSEAALKAIKKNYHSIKDIFYADAFGVDFHKCFAPISSSIFIYKNANHFEQLLNRQQAAYLQSRTPYNPHDYSLEVSRAAGGSMAGWAVLKGLGLEGFQSILGGILENRIHLLKQIKNYQEFVCVNDRDDGLVSLLRIYPKGTNATDQYKKELMLPDYKNDLSANNKLTYDIGELLWKWFREKKQVNGRDIAYLSVSSGFRTTIYNADMKDKDAVIYAIKIYPVNIFVTPEIMDHAIDCIIAARNEIMK